MKKRTYQYLLVLFSFLYFNNAFSQQESVYTSMYTFKSKLEDKKRTQIISWSDKKVYTLSDTIRLVVESNQLLDEDPLTDLALSNLKKGRTSRGTLISNGKIHSYSLIEYFPVKTGSIEIPSLKAQIKNKSYKTRKIKISII